MGSLIIGSILVVPTLIARYAAGRKGPRRALKWTILVSFGFSALYALSLIYLYFRFA